jgi:hypothetical protein
VKTLMMVLLATVFAVACSSEKEPAEMAVTGLETAASPVRPDIMAAVNAAVAAVKTKFDGGNYAGALADVQAASGTVTAAAEAAAARKAALSTEWAAFAGLPTTVGQIEARMSELAAMRRLPRGMDKARLDGARSSLDSAKALWDEATDAQEDGDLVLAVSKAKDASPMIESLVSTLGIATPAR